jgi:hypothetical protein
MRYRQNVLLMIAFAASSALATAASAKTLGDIQVTAVRPGPDEQDENITDFTFLIDEGRILATSPGNPNTFDLTKEDNGCLRGTVALGRYGAPHPASSEDDSLELRQICPVAAGATDGAGMSRWMDQSSKLTFTTQVTAKGSRVLVESGSARAEFRLGRGAAADELRKRPELIAAAFAYGYVPSSDATSNGTVDAYQFVVAPQK